MKLTERILLLMLVLGGIAYGIYWCVNSGPCANICPYIPSFLQKLFGLCNGPGPGGGGGTCGAGGQCGSPDILQQLNDTLAAQEKAAAQTGPGCTGDNCVAIPAGQDNGISNIGGS